MRNVLGMVVALLWAFPHSLRAEEAATRDPILDPATAIYVANADGSGMKRLVPPSEYEQQKCPTWSRDGKWIAYHAWRPVKRESFQNSRVFVVPSDGGVPRMLSDGAMPSFSPGGKRIAFSRYAPNRGVWVMSSDGPEAELALIDDRGWGPEWSPDGTRIVYAVAQPDVNFMVLDLIEGDRAVLFDREKSPYLSLMNSHSTWSPDSRRIALLGTRSDNSIELGIMDARGVQHGLEIRLKDAVAPGFAWSPDGQRLLISLRHEERQANQLYQLEATGNAAPQLLPGQIAERNNLECAYSPDGTKLAISSAPGTK